MWEWIIAFANGKLDLSERPLREGLGLRGAGDAEEAKRGIELLATRLEILSLSRASPGDCVASNLATLREMVPPQFNVIYAKYIAEPMIGAAAFV